MQRHHPKKHAGKNAAHPAFYERLPPWATGWEPFFKLCFASKGNLPQYQTAVNRQTNSITARNL